MKSQRKDWHTLSLLDTYAELKTTEKGLSESEVEKRIDTIGKNELPKPPRLSAFKIFWSQYKNPMAIILIVAAAISGFVHEFVDMAVIIAALFINTILGFVQEYKANKSIEALRELLKYETKVIRDGRQMTIQPENVVPGDILVLDSGDRVPADARIVWQKNFEVNEAPLTGESLPVKKSQDVLAIGIPLADRTNMVFMGTTVTAGRAHAIVTQTGVRTHFGEVASLIHETPDEQTPLQDQLYNFTRFLGILLLLLSLSVFLIGVVQKRDLIEMLLISVAIAVSSVPEGLLVSLTAVLALGMQRILKENALVRKLVAAETLGSVSVICSDKTGTLTEGEMRVASIITSSQVFSNKKGSPDKQITSDNLDNFKGLGLTLRISVLCNNATVENLGDELAGWKVSGNPTDKALMLAGIEAGLKPTRLLAEYEELDEVPFSSKTKYMAKLFTYREESGENIVYMKGAPEKILDWAGYQDINGNTKILNKASKDKLKKEYLALTKEGLRVIGVGYKITKQAALESIDFNNFVFVGFIGLKDPLRAEAYDAITQCQRAGIHPVIITGDHQLTATAIAEELGLNVSDGAVITGVELDEISEKEFAKRVKSISVYARVEPRQKVRIVQAWRNLDNTVAMIGDGINDAPALKAADIGVAVGAGTDVTKQIADMILLDNNYSTIVSAVRNGRVIFDNIRKIVVYLLADSFSEVILVTASLLIGAPLPVTAVQILWINLVADGFPNLALTAEPGEKDVMEQPPRSKSEPLLNKEMKSLIFIIGIVTDLVLLVLFIYMWQDGMELARIQTIIFLALGIDSLLYVFSVKSLRRTLLHINPFSNIYLLGAVAIGFVLQFSAVLIPGLRSLLGTVPVGLNEMLLVLGLAVIKIILIEITKLVFIIRDKHNHSRVLA